MKQQIKFFGFKRKRIRHSRPARKVTDRSMALWEAHTFEGLEKSPKTPKENSTFNKWYRADEELKNMNHGGRSAKNRRKALRAVARYAKVPINSPDGGLKRVAINLRMIEARRIRQQRKNKIADKAMEEAYWKSFRKK